MAEQIIKLARKFALTHRQYSSLYDSFDDYISELEFAIVNSMINFDNTKGAFSTWCFTVCGNKIIRDLVHRFRQKRLNETVSLDMSINDDGCSLSEFITDDTVTLESIEDRLNKSMIFKALYPYLSENFKAHFFNDKTLEEIAIATNTSKQNVNQKLDREIERLKAALEDDNFKLITRYKNRHNAARYAKEHNISVKTYYKYKDNGLIDEEEINYDIRTNL